MDPLAFRLYGLLDATHRALGIPSEPLTSMLNMQCDDVQLHEISPSGVLGFVNNYVLIAYPDDEMPTACRNAFRLEAQRLRERGLTRHMVHPLNFRSVKLTRKLGATPIGYDEDGFMHYVLHAQNYPHFEDRRRG